ncbi:MAG: Threonine-tRNA ligase [Candidatus Woesebacteria bacterium GW2011_GWC1_38_13]|uniref:Threonine--tRNA ligase n=3 Tax=Candidatus Woeseibacteriota TaxID=1752722 RepID=A0A0G0NF42_9BACT|nr:MAG: Threonine-tRNA ligase [Candidatus Woesebacteria bacterium GW2011_GWD1_38_10]KKQ56961.1 MAG: Threonine-tRNA ligase [Candidatus Woesebacteria bacterium GW2011_GWC1_38_13]KKQ84529.1 MAG: Threonine-tRNA ligase [Candidatus Woesebacteria bacterium GW2011_GWA1_38_8]
MDIKLENLRHSTSHLMAAAVLELFPNAKPTLGPPTEDGFYYDFDELKISEDDLPKIEERMREIVKSWGMFEKLETSNSEAIEQYKNNPYKKELIEEHSKSGEKITLYKSGNFIDLCKGGHIENPQKELKYFKLLSVAGAYWRGNEKNKMLTRIYGTAFFSQKELDEYLKNIEEAKKRDHRKLGKELDLFHIDERVGLGLPLWHPKGAILWREIEDFWYKEHLKNGYGLVRTPHIGNSELWKTSGHLNFYNSSMYPPLEAGQALEEKQQGKKVDVSEEYYLKPMNCPFHLQIYSATPKSYRDLPLRWAECGTVYRYEKKGELSGLIRVRGFTQDDAHIICRKDQVEEELERVIDFIIYIYKSFGFEMDKVQVFLSLRDPDNKTKYAGDDTGWDFTEKVLRKVANKCKLNFTEEKGEAAFYGPKLDFKIKDALGRLWQCSTLQFDFNLPAKFGIEYTNDRGEKETPYMLHRALFGSYERFIGLLIEHYAGNFPTWLTPVQVKVLPITDKQLGYAKTVVDKLKTESIRVELDDRSETLGAKIRDAQKEKVAYMLIVGEREVKDGTVSERGRSGKDYGSMKLEEFIKNIKEEIDRKTIN